MLTTSEVCEAAGMLRLDLRVRSEQGGVFGLCWSYRPTGVEREVSLLWGDCLVD